MNKFFWKINEFGLKLTLDEILISFTKSFTGAKRIRLSYTSEEHYMNKYFNKAGEFMIRWGWKVLDAEAKKAMLKELTPKPVKKAKLIKASSKDIKGDSLKGEFLKASGAFTPEKE